MGHSCPQPVACRAEAVQSTGPAKANGQADLVELGYRVTMNVTADAAGIDRPENRAEETQRLLEMVKIFSEGATLVHSLKDKEAVRKQVLEVRNAD